MLRGKYFTSQNNLNAEAIALRQLIPEFNCGADEHDLMAFYAVAYDENDVPCGSGRLYIDDDSRFRIDFLGVTEPMRGKYVGDLLARMLLYKAEELNAPSIYALVPNEYLRFFARYGLTAIESIGDKTEMSADAEQIRLEGSCSKNRGATCSGNCASCH